MMLLKTKTTLAKIAIVMAFAIFIFMVYIRNASILYSDIKEYSVRTTDELGQQKDEKRNNFLGTGNSPRYFSLLSIRSAQLILHRHLTSTEYKCKRIKRFGNPRDGGYDVCMDDVFSPKHSSCLVYSFGIRDDWSFDDAVNKDLGCDVYSFDPSMRTENHTHREPNMYFYKLGIWGSNLRNDKKWELRDLATIVKSFKHDNRVIDYLKVDVEGAEWPLISHLTSSDVYKQIKQIGIELHTPRTKKENQSMTITDYGEVLYRLSKLEGLGFKKFKHYTNNDCCGGFSELTSASIAKKRLCCYEEFYVNERFLPKSNQNSIVTPP